MKKFKQYLADEYVIREEPINMSDVEMKAITTMLNDLVDEIEEIKRTIKQ